MSGRDGLECQVEGSMRCDRCRTVGPSERCDRCRTVGPSEAKFCLECGASLRPQTQPPRLPSAGRRADLQPVLSTIAGTAARLCVARDALIYLVDGSRLRLAATHGSRPDPRVVGDTLAIGPGGPGFVAESRKHESWRAIPVLVVTGKGISDDDRVRLDGGVERILQKGTSTRESLLQEVRDLVTACIAR